MPTMRTIPSRPYSVRKRPGPISQSVKKLKRHKFVTVNGSSPKRCPDCLDFRPDECNSGLVDSMTKFKFGH